MKISQTKIIQAAKHVAKEFRFDDPENAFWQCNLYSNAVVKVAKLYDIHSFNLILVMATWQTDSGDVQAGQTYRHILVENGGTYYDFTIRQINDKAKFPYVSNKLPKYYKEIGEVEIEYDIDERQYINALVEYIEPDAKVKYETKDDGTDDT